MRAGHRKTRTGCTQCKRRRVKCDEAKPTCQNCHRNDLSCSLDFLTPLTSLSRHNRKPSYQQEPKAKRRKLIKMYPLSTHLIPSLSPTNFSPQTNELLHHYTTTLYKTLSIERSRSVWRIEMPLLGIAHPFVLSGLLSLSALHLSSLIPSRRRELLNFAVSQECAALPSFRAHMANPSPHTIDAVFTFAGNAIYYAMASPRDMYGAGTGEESQQWQADRCRLPSRNDEYAHWFIMMRGLMAFLSKNWAGIVKGPFAPLLQGDAGPVYAELNPDDGELVKLERLFEFGSESESLSLSSLPQPSESVPSEGLPISQPQPQPLLRPTPSFSSPSSSPHPHQQTYTLALLELRRVSALPFSPNRTICAQTAAHMWPGSVNQDFIELIYERDERALVLLAHYCVLLKRVDHVWYLKGLGEGLLRNIWGVLGREGRSWIGWAVERVLGGMAGWEGVLRE
ncbi:hypothetical protein BKA61DRAFT_689000 [Leptodontidium sp. MPI-SDFR-AT-0119]|nr:hypothetical protein BKA61DRAFT_689000 [Leptodontidium sp. MPI-SDFR-AT-0119]